MIGYKVEILVNRGIFNKGDIGYLHSDDGSGVMQYRCVKDKGLVGKYLDDYDYEFFHEHEIKFIEFAPGDKVMYMGKTASVTDTNVNGTQIEIRLLEDSDSQWVRMEVLEHVNVEELLAEINIGDKVKFKWRTHEGTGEVVEKTTRGYLSIEDGLSLYRWAIFVSDVEVIEEKIEVGDIVKFTFMEFDGAGKVVKIDENIHIDDGKTGGEWIISPEDVSKLSEDDEEYLKVLMNLESRRLKCSPFKKGDLVDFTTFGAEYFGTVVDIDGDDVIIKDGEDDLLFDWIIDASDVRFRPKFEDGDEVFCAYEEELVRGVITQFDEEYNSYLIQFEDELLWCNENQFLKARNVFQDVREWAAERGLNESPAEKQFLKTVEEVGEVGASLARGRNPIDDIGDAGITLEVLANIHGFTLEEAVEHAYNEIKDRTGKTVDGVFIKDEE